VSSKSLSLRGAERRGNLLANAKKMIFWRTLIVVAKRGFVD
jgi:hypothetical protein